MKRILHYLNPIAHLGDKKHSFLFPFLVSISTCFILEGYAYRIARDPNAVGAYAIFVFVALIIYFAFRDGFRGGYITTFMTISYYFYIIYTRNYTGDQLTAGIRTTIILAVLYVFLASTIGWLKHTIDYLIEREADERRRLQALMHQLPVGVMVTDHVGRVVQTNKRLDTLLGAKIPSGYQIGKDKPLLKSLAKDKVATSAHSPLLLALTRGKAVVGREFTVEKPDGKKVGIRVNSAVIRNKQGKIIAAASIIDDITAHKEMEKRKDDFVNIASHELKTPITSMKLFVDVLLRRKTYDQKSDKMLTSVKNQILRLQDLVSDLLDVSRLQTGKLTFRKEEFRLDKVVAETVEELQQITTETEIVVVKKTPIVIYADKFRIMQVVTNLVTNAVKYSAPNTTINVAIRRKSNYAVVSVQDFGIGIPPDHQRKIFQRLYQAPGSQARAFRGLGMGLYICREIIRRHHGKIWVESEKGKGSTFYFTLPLS